MSAWSRGALLLAVLSAAVASADVPSAFVTWFAGDFAATNSPGAWRLDAEGWLGFTPEASRPAGDALEVRTFRASMRPFSSRAALPDLSATEARGALLAANRHPRCPVFFGWTCDGWVELAGAVPDEGDALQEVSIEIDASVVPATVSYAVDGVRLVSADDVLRARFPVGAPRGTDVAPLAMRGAGILGAFSAACASPDRAAAVRLSDGSWRYFTDVPSAAAAARASGGEAVVLRRAELAAPVGAPLALAPELMAASRPPLRFAGDWPAGAEQVVRLPVGCWRNVLLAEPARAVRNLHVHGEPGRVYRLESDAAADAVRLSVAAVPLDAGAFTGWLAIPEGGRLFAAGLRDAGLGSDRSLYVQGNGVLTLCGTNEISGGVQFESGRFALCTPDAAPVGPVARERYHETGLLYLLR